MQKEIDGHNNIHLNINHSSQKIFDSYKNQSEKENLQRKIDEINKRWILLRKKSLEIRSKLESNSTHWSALLNSLSELINWCKAQNDQLKFKHDNLQLDVNHLQKQINDFKVSSTLLKLF